MSSAETSKNKSSQENIIIKAYKLKLKLQSITTPTNLTSGINQDFYQVSRLDLEINFSVEYIKVLCAKTRLTC